jgi:C-terminal processing protease CtpA/Prc
MNHLEITQILEHVGRLVAERYVFPDIGEQLSRLLGERASGGSYPATDDLATLAGLVTADLQSINGDQHLRLKHHPTPPPDGPGGTVAAQLARDAGVFMGGVARIERLDGNVGYLDLRPSLFPPSMAGDAVTAAMQLVARAGALLIDVRGVRGGDPATVALLCSYLFDEPTHLNTMHIRDGGGTRTLQSWTVPYVPGPRFGGSKPVYVLIGPSTFSGGEELGYVLQQLARATLVGERTAGAAHPRAGIRVHPHLELALPTGRPVHPVTGTNWEGRGVQPDIEVPAGDACHTAHQEALKATG